MTAVRSLNHMLLIKVGRCVARLQTLDVGENGEGVVAAVDWRVFQIGLRGALVSAAFGVFRLWRRMDFLQLNQVPSLLHLQILLVAEIPRIPIKSIMRCISHIFARLLLFLSRRT